MRRATVLLLVGLSWPVWVHAQKNCKKGIPCGNTCIAANKVCRIGAISPAPAPLIDARATPEASVASLAVKDLNAPWVAFKDGSIYYRNVMGCEVARVPVRAERFYFKSEEDAKRAGFNASREVGCQ
jgi:hypothetical protein